MINYLYHIYLNCVIELFSCADNTINKQTKIFNKKGNIFNEFIHAFVEFLRDSFSSLKYIHTHITTTTTK